MSRRHKRLNKIKKPTPLKGIIAASLSACSMVIFLAFSGISSQTAGEDLPKLMIGLCFLCLVTNVFALSITSSQLRIVEYDFSTRLICFLLSLFGLVIWAGLYFMGLVGFSF